jgi:hypothetical protein
VRGVWRKSCSPIVVATTVVVLAILWALIVTQGQGTILFWTWNEQSWQAVAAGLLGLAVLYLAYRANQIQEHQRQRLEDQGQALQKQNSILKMQIALLEKNIRSSTFSMIEGRVYDFNKFLIDHPKVSEGHMEAYHKPTIEQDRQVADLADIVLTIFEELFYQYNEYDLVDEKIWHQWLIVIKDYMNSHKYLYGHLEDPEHTHHYSDDFRDMLSGLKDESVT